MNRTLRALALSSFLTTLVTTGLSAYPSFAEANGVDFWNFGHYNALIQTCEDHRSELERENDVVIERMNLKEAIVRDLLNESISFEEAAIRFVEANRTLSPEKLACYVQGNNDFERGCWQLISYLSSGRGEVAASLARDWECLLSSQV